MAKLRLIQPRSSDGEIQGDLRGLQDPELFLESRLTVHLTVSGVRDLDALHLVAHAYSLTMEPHPKRSGWFQLSTGWKTPGEHKKQGVHLFIAAMDVMRSLPGTRCLIHQKDGLKALIDRK